MRKKQLALVVGGLLLISAMAPAVAAGHTSKAVYDWHVGDALIGSIGFPTNSQATASNGDVVTIVGTGSFSADGKWADGGGTFTHHVAATDATITGTWVATSLISFQSYGCGELEGSPVPPTATPDANPSVHLSGALTITCVVGTNVTPRAVEGVRVNVYDVINFNKTVPESGANIFIQQ
ncbi:MAG: hypothetical protein E6I94_10735 [Chloroflexi bacterium]|nr:MAG: hypothetical protein E6I94_10735 [Chloroflexota bacterium]